MGYILQNQAHSGKYVAPQEYEKKVLNKETRNDGYVQQKQIQQKATSTKSSTQQVSKPASKSTSTQQVSKPASKPASTQQVSKPAPKPTYTPPKVEPKQSTPPVQNAQPVAKPKPAPAPSQPSGGGIQIKGDGDGNIDFN